MLFTPECEDKLTNTDHKGVAMARRWNMPTVKHCYWFISSISVFLRRSCCYVSCYDWPVGLTSVHTEKFNSCPHKAIISRSSASKEGVSSLWLLCQELQKQSHSCSCKKHLKELMYCTVKPVMRQRNAFKRIELLGEMALNVTKWRSLTMLHIYGHIKGGVTLTIIEANKT